MKRNVSILLIVLCILAISTLILFAQEVKYDFRKTNWGMSKEQVKATEKNKIAFEDKETIAINRVQVDGKECVYVYFFLEDKLYKSSYGFMENHTNENLYINDYEELKEILIKKYGEPDKKKLLTLYGRGEIYWEDDLFKDDRSEWGLAVSLGDLSYSLIWETPTTRIELILDGDNYEINLRIVYISRKLEEWANKIIEEKAKSDF